MILLMQSSTRRCDLRFYLSNLTGYLTRSVRLASARLFRQPPRAPKGNLAGLLALGLSLCITALALKEIEPKALKKSSITQELKPIDYQIYALQQLRDIKEWRCLLTLYSKESAWNALAVNGSHYGIPQGNSKWLKDKDGFIQVDWGIKYNKARYHSMCKALNHWKRYGWH